MILTGDYHTHTVYSHGKGKIMDNAASAAKKGINTIAITDHGFSHPAFGMSRKLVLQMQTECYEATKATGVKVLLGMESNILNDSGKTDYKVTDYDNFDVFIAGFHKFVIASPIAYFGLLMPNEIIRHFTDKPPKWLIKETTKAYINVIKKNPVDIITHINSCVFADAVEVAKCCADYGTYFELNAKRKHLTDDEVLKIAETKARFIVDSDAHDVLRIGDTLSVDEQLKRVGFPFERIDNIDGRTPDFRFKKYKEERK